MTSVFLPQYLLVLKKSQHALTSNYTMHSKEKSSIKAFKSLYFSEIAGLNFEEND